MSLLKKILNPQLILYRNVGKCNYNWYDEGIQYHGFKYYPRYFYIKLILKHFKIFILEIRTLRILLMKQQSYLELRESNQ